MRSAFALLLAGGLLASAQAADKPWSNTADFGFVMTDGNSKTENLSLGNKFTRTWEKLEMTLLAKAVRAEATKRTVTGDANTNEIRVQETTEKSAETYELGAKFKGQLVGQFQWYTNLGWFQDKLAGVDQRLTAGAGFGYTVFKNDTHSLASEAGFDFTDESPVIGEGDSFGSARLFLGYLRPLSPTSELSGSVETLSNMSNSDDFRSNINLALASRLSDKLAMKLGYTLKYDGDPVQEAVSGTTAKFVYDKTDTVLSMSLVLNL